MPPKAPSGRSIFRPAVVDEAGLAAEGVHPAGGALPADEAMLLDQQHTRTVIRGSESGVHPGHAAAGAQNGYVPLLVER